MIDELRVFCTHFSRAFRDYFYIMSPLIGTHFT